MSLNRKQYDILVLLESKQGALSQREIAQETGMSVGSANKILGELTEQGLVAGGSITEAGLSALEPYRVRRAIFIAAGFGSRLVPITLNTPKPLVRVKGKRIIDSLLDAIVAAGIEEIYIVRGYLAEQFDQLLHKYPMIKFLENPVYNETNNISSVYAARHLLAGSYIFEADLFLYNPKIITKYQYHTNYIAVPCEKTDDWCFMTDAGGVVKKLQIGGVGCYHLYGISYWTEEDGTRLARHIENVYNNVPGGKERYWDQVPCETYLSEYKIHVRPCTFGDIIEIDTFNELKKIDSNYAM